MQPPPHVCSMLPNNAASTVSQFFLLDKNGMHVNESLALLDKDASLIHNANVAGFRQHAASTRQATQQVDWRRFGSPSELPSGLLCQKSWRWAVCEGRLTTFHVFHAECNTYLIPRQRVRCIWMPTASDPLRHCTRASQIYVTLTFVRSNVHTTLAYGTSRVEDECGRTVVLSHSP